MADGLADSRAPTNGQTKFTDWVTANAESLGRRYINDTRATSRQPNPPLPRSCSHD